jgi:hypothetical protein
MTAIFLRYGAIGGVIVTVLMFLPYFIFGAKPELMKAGEVFGYTSMVLSMTAVFFAVRRERERRGGVIGFGGALATGAGVSLVASLIFGIATWVFYTMVGDSLPEAIMAFYIQQVRESGADAATIAAQVAELEGMRPFFFNRLLQGVVMFATVFLIGAVMSLVAALVFRRAPRTAMA